MSIIGRIARIEVDNGRYAMGMDGQTTFTLQVIGEARGLKHPMLNRVDLQPGDEVEIINLEKWREERASQDK